MRFAVMLLLCASCFVPPRPYYPPPAPAPAQPQVASAASGNRTARAYDVVAHALVVIGRAPADSRHLYLAAHLAGTTARVAGKALSQVARAKRAGTWTAGLRYQVDGGKILDEGQLLANLATMRTRAHTLQHELRVRLDAAYRAEYPHASAIQLAELHRLGPPAKVAMIDAPRAHGRHHHKKSKVTCWVWSKRRAYLATCWKADGSVALRHQWNKSTEVAAARAPAPAAAADDSAVETSVDTSSIAASDASDSTAQDMASADDATAAADVGSTESASSASGSSDSGSSDTASGDSGSSDSGSSDSGSTDSASSDSGSSDSGSSDSGSSDSGSSDSSASEAPAEPAQPACLPDGADTDDWNKCCGGHWSHHTGEDGHTCCSEVGGDCS